MRPRNLTFFRFPQALDLSDLASHMEECALKPIGPLELSSRGFVRPFSGSEFLSFSVALTANNGVDWITVGGEDKLLPGAVVNAALAKKLAEVEEKEGRKPGGRTRKRLKDDLIHEMLPKAFVRPARTDAALFSQACFIVIDTASRRVAESVVSEVRRAMGSFPALPVNAEVAPRSVLTGWLSGDPLPANLALGTECTLVDPADRGAKVRITNMELNAEEVLKHLETGMQVTRLGLVLEDKIGFELGDDLVVRKYKLLDVERAETETEHEDVGSYMRAELYLQGFNIARVFEMIRVNFKLSDPG